MQNRAKYVPFNQTDFIFTVVAEELGFLGGALLIGCYFLLLYRATNLALFANNYFGVLTMRRLHGTVGISLHHQHRHDDARDANHRRAFAIFQLRRFELPRLLAVRGIAAKREFAPQIILRFISHKGHKGLTKETKRKKKIQGTKNCFLFIFKFFFFFVSFVRPLCPL